MRKLQYVIEDRSTGNDVIEIQYNQTHPIRHEKKNRHRFKERHNSTLSHRFHTDAELNKNKKQNVTGKVNNLVDNQTVISYKSANNNSDSFNSNNGTEEILKKKLDAHQNCYTTNEVLEIIAITCLVNFIFWFLIISCVNFYTKNQKVWKSDR